jgi:hypothetical protein
MQGAHGIGSGAVDGPPASAGVEAANSARSRPVRAK